MSHRSRAIFLLLTIIAVLFVSAFGTTNVYADDGTPPPPPAETEEVDPSTSEAEPVATEPAVEPVATEEPAVEPVATEAPVTEEPAEEVAPSEEAPVAEEEAAPAAEETLVVEEQQPAEEEAAPLLEQIPDNTTVTILNEEGDAQPLTSQESAEAIATGDPIWCPKGVVNPTPGANGCTISYTNMTDLLVFLKANEGDAAYQKAGTIYIQMGDYTGTETSIDFNSYNFTSLNKFDLILQGGWDPADNSKTDITNFNVPIIIGSTTNPWGGSLTLNNISITDVSNQTGLTLVSSNNIALSSVQVTDSLGGADLNAGKNVSVKKSQFNGNRMFGAKITAGGSVQVSDSDFNYNAIEKDQYDGYGLKINSQGAVTLSTVSASYNEAFGADINSAKNVSVWNSTFNGNLSYTHNCGYTYKAKTCHDCTEKANGGFGLKVISTGTGSAGDIFLQAVTANDNYEFGAHLEGTSVSVVGGTVNGVFKGSTFNGNGSGELNDPQGYGLQIVSTIDQSALPRGQAAVTISDVDANNNQLFGADVTAVGDVEVITSIFDGNKSYYNNCTSPKKTCEEEECKDTYYGYGLKVVTSGNVDLDTVEANDNYLYGAHLTGKNVNIGDSTFSNNANPAMTGEGLQIIAAQDANLSYVTASYNEAFGANILAAANVNINASAFNGQKVYTYSGDCTDEDKKTCEYEPCVKTLVGGGYGLQVVATGEESLIQLTAVTASDNYLDGMRLFGWRVRVSGNETTGEHTQANDNGKEGIKIEAQETVSLSLVEASNNKIAGATILSGLNQALDGTVLIANSIFNGNASYTSSYCKGKTYYGYGLKVVTTADKISVVNVTANDNNLYGAHLEGAIIDVYSNEGFTSSFSSNGPANGHIGRGLEIISTGAGNQVSVSDVIASDNQLFGADIQAEGAVYVTDSVFSLNQSYTSTSCGCKTYDGYGIRVVTDGNVTVDTVKAEQNYLYGAHLEGANVTIRNSTFSNNVSPFQQGKTPTGRGLEVKSAGEVFMSGVHADKNQLFGATIEAGGAVEILSSSFLDNKYTTYTSCKGNKTAGYGLKVVATDPALASPIKLDGVTASGNGAEGAILEAESAAVNVLNSTFSGNGADGLNITASGDVTLTNVIAESNKGDGVDVKSTCTSKVYVNGGKFAGNSQYGIKTTDATYTPDGLQEFSSNGSGNVFNSSTCVVEDEDDGGDSSDGSGNTGGNNGSNWWYWWWYWHRGHHHRH